MFEGFYHNPDNFGHYSKSENQAIFNRDSARLKKPKEPLDVFSGVLLSHGLHRSTIGAGGLNYRVRKGIGCTPSAITTEHIHRLSVDG